MNLVTRIKLLCSPSHWRFRRYEAKLKRDAWNQWWTYFYGPGSCDAMPSPGRLRRFDESMRAHPGGLPYLEVLKRLEKK